MVVVVVVRSWFDGDGNTTKDNSSIKSVSPSALGRGRINYVCISCAKG